MDSITQIVLGASVGEAALGKKVGNKAILWGAIGGTIPDLDVLCKFFVDDVRSNELHRGFSHSIVFSILMAPVLGWLISYVHKKSNATWKEWTWLSFLALITHPLLDCHTGYGTQFFWPFEYRVAYQNIFVADPVYTVPFLVLMIMVMVQRRESNKRRRYNMLALTISSAYMLITIIFKGYAFSKFSAALDNQHVEYTELDTRPTPLNSLLWMASVETKDHLSIGYYSLLDRSDSIRFIPFDKNHHLLGDMKESEVIQSLIKLSNGWYLIEKQGDTLYFNDIRFGQAGISDNPSNFIYSFEIGKKEGKVYAKQRPRKRVDMGKAFASIYHRIWNAPQEQYDK